MIYKLLGSINIEGITRILFNVTACIWVWKAGHAASLMIHTKDMKIMDQAGRDVFLCIVIAGMFFLAVWVHWSVRQDSSNKEGE